MALGSAAVLTVYAAGFTRTRAAAQALEEGSGARRRPPAAVGNPGAGGAAGHEVRAADAPASTAPTDAAAPVAAVTAADARPLPSASPSAGAAGVAPMSMPAAAPARPQTAPAASATDGPSPVAPVATKSPAAGTSGGPAATTSPSGTAAANAPAAPAGTPAPVVAASASAPAPASATPPTADSAKSTVIRDGTYTGWGTSRHGDIEATVVIEQGKITGAIISRCLTRYSCSWVAHLQQQVVTRQSPEVDNVSGATQSANAFYYAVVDALAKAK